MALDAAEQADIAASIDALKAQLDTLKAEIQAGDGIAIVQVLQVANLASALIVKVTGDIVS